MSSRGRGRMAPLSIGPPDDCRYDSVAAGGAAHLRFDDEKMTMKQQQRQLHPTAMAIIARQQRHLMASLVGSLAPRLPLFFVRRRRYLFSQFLALFSVVFPFAFVLLLLRLVRPKREKLLPVHDVSFAVATSLCELIMTKHTHN